MKMKKVLGLAVLGLSLSSTLSYAIDSTGCGLGSTILKGQRGVLPQILAVTTNGTSASQTFGITSGTLGCDSNGKISGGTGKILVFLENNVDSFALDAARGEGETINVIASIAGLDSKETGILIKNNFDELFPNENVNVVEVSQKLSTILSI
jgi:hypothetical protein